MDHLTEHQNPGIRPTRREVVAGAVGAAGLLAGATAGTPAYARAGRHAGGRFAGKTVVITGATSGIGKATAIAFAKQGAKVFFCGRRVALGRGVEREIRTAGGEATYMRADVRRERDVAAFVDACVRRYGGIDIAFNNAGIETPNAVPLHQQTLADIEAVWRTNAAGVFLSMKYELPHLLSKGRGAIINNASVSAEVGFATIAPYSSSKHAIAGLTKVAALEYAAMGVRVNAVAPGAVDTPMLRRAAEAFGQTYEEMAQDYPIRRIVAADEIARVVMWLAADDASPVVGTNIDATGGYLAQ